MTEASQRFVRLEGCVNFRDVGGYPTRSGRTLRTGQVFRSDALHLLTASDIVHLRQQLRIGQIIDLRSTGELRVDGRGLLEAEPIHFRHLPIFDGDASANRDLPATMDLADRYFFMADLGGRMIGRIVTAIAEAPAPTVYHCSAGKDRTGVISALLLSLLDVDADIITGDYALSQERLPRIVERLAADKGYWTAVIRTLPPETLHARPQTMTAFFEKLHAKYGSTHAYFRAAGVTDRALEQLRQRLVLG
ncbi:MAG: tyrosine-protein phosphatase [Candidatus Binatia bacterium]